MFGNSEGYAIIPPAIKVILISSVVIFLAQQVPILGNELIRLGALWPVKSGNFMPWQLITYAFLHGGFFHIFFNMYVLWAFGSEIENYWGTKHFTYYYAVCGIGAALLNMAVSSTMYPTIGASGSIYGVLLAFGMMFPDRVVLFYFLFPIKVKYLVIIYAVVEFLSGISAVSDNIAHFAHLGGMIFGFVYIKIMNGDIPIVEWYKKIFVKNPTFHVEQKPKAREFSESTKKEREKVVDAILDKITKLGYESLSDEEKKILLDASKSID